MMFQKHSQEVHIILFVMFNIIAGMEVDVRKLTSKEAEELQSGVLDVNIYLRCLQSYGQQSSNEVTPFLFDIVKAIQQTAEFEKTETSDSPLKVFVKELDIKGTDVRNLQIISQLLSKCLRKSYTNSDFIANLQSSIQLLNSKIEVVQNNSSSTERHVPGSELLVVDTQTGNLSRNSLDQALTSVPSSHESSKYHPQFNEAPVQYTVDEELISHSFIPKDREMKTDAHPNEVSNLSLSPRDALSQPLSPNASAPELMDALINTHQPSIKRTDERSSHSTGPRLEKSNYTHFSNSPSSYSSDISSFSSSFYQKITVSESLQRAFSITLPASYASEVFYHAFYYAFKEFGVLQPEAAVSSIAEAVEGAFDDISSCSFAIIIANSVGQYLFNERVLSSVNYSVLSAQLANIIEQSINNPRESPLEKHYIQGLANGIVKFLSTLETLSSKKASTFASYLANELIFSNEDADICLDRVDSRLPIKDTIIPTNELFDNLPALNEDLVDDINYDFSSILMEDIASSEILSKFVDLQLTTDEVASIAYESIYKITMSLGLPNPSRVAWKIAQAILFPYDDLSISSYVRIVANSVAQFLTASGFLTYNNAAELAHYYSRALTQAAITVPSNDPPYSYVKAFIEATHRFVMAQFILDLSNTKSLGSVFINELKKATGFRNLPKSPINIKINISLPALVWDVFPEIYSSVGLSSDKATSRVRKLAETIAGNGSLPSAKGIDMRSFVRSFISVISDIRTDNPGLNLDGLLIETLLETLSALVAVIEGAKILKVDLFEQPLSNLALAEAFRKEIY